MRIPIFAKHSNPQIDRPILRKKLAYIQLQLARGEVYAINPDNLSLGVICRGIHSLREVNTELFAAGSGFDTAWAIRQSGIAGPLTWQLNHANG